MIFWFHFLWSQSEIILILFLIGGKKVKYFKSSLDYKSYGRFFGYFTLTDSFDRKLSLGGNNSELSRFNDMDFKKSSATARKVFYQMREKRFFFGKWFTVIFFNKPLGTPLRGLNMFTWRPTLIFLVRAPCGNTAWTWGTTVLFTTPPNLTSKKIFYFALQPANFTEMYLQVQWHEPPAWFWRQ